MSTTSIHVTLPQALKDHIEKRVAEGEFTSPSDYVRALVRAERAYQEKRAALLRDIDVSFTARATCRRSSAPPSPSSCGLPVPAIKIWYSISALPATIRT